VNCDQLSFSPDGHYLGFRYGQDSCGRSLRLIDRLTGGTLLDLKGRVHTYAFLSNGKVIIDAGTCEGSSTSFFDPLTRQTVIGGGVGVRVWNSDLSIFVEAAEDYMSSSSTLWGYSLNSARVFNPNPETTGRIPFDKNVIFMPDGKRFIYQHLTYQLNPKSLVGSFNSPMQIVRYDPKGGEHTVLTSDPAHNYRLCQFDNTSECPLQWFRDWIQVQRLPYKSHDSDPGWSGTVILDQPCLFEGQKCDVPPESMALNTYNGELRPWNPSSLPLAYPTPTPTPGPNGTPVYKDPDGRFAF
jgi:hypothetical protein